MRHVGHLPRLLVKTVCRSVLSMDCNNSSEDKVALTTFQAVDSQKFYYKKKSAGLLFLLVLAKCLPFHYWFRHRHRRLTMRAVGLWVKRSHFIFIYFSSLTSICLLALCFEKSLHVKFRYEVKDQCQINKICRSGVPARAPPFRYKCWLVVRSSWSRS